MSIGHSNKHNAGSVSRNPQDPRGGFKDRDSATVIRQGLDGHRARDRHYDDLSPDEVGAAIHERRNAHTYQEDWFAQDDQDWGSDG